MAAGAKKNGWSRTLGVIAATLVFLICAVICVWWFVIFKYGPDVEISNTFNVPMQQATDGTQRPVLELNYFKNTTGNGLEALEIKYNYFTDETQSLFTSQGLQYVETEKGAGLKWDFKPDLKAGLSYVGEKNIFLTTWEKEFNAWGRFNPTSDHINYSSLDNFAKPAGSADPINNKSYFKIQIGEDLYMMKFKDTNRPFEGQPYSVVQKADYEYYVLWSYLHKHNYFVAYDHEWLSMALYDLVKSTAAGQNSVNYFELGDYFTYYKWDGAKYVDTTPAETAKVKANMKSYYSIKITTHADGLHRANQSMFKAVLGSPNYNANGDYSSDDYFTGKTIVSLSENDFDFVKVTDGFYAAKLKSEFVKNYFEYKSQIALSIEIDLNVLAQKGISFVGMTNDWNSTKFLIYEAYTSQLVNGEIVKEVIEC